MVVLFQIAITYSSLGFSVNFQGWERELGIIQELWGSGRRVVSLRPNWHSESYIWKLTQTQTQTCKHVWKEKKKKKERTGHLELYWLGNHNCTVFHTRYWVMQGHILKAFSLTSVSFLKLLVFENISSLRLGKPILCLAPFFMSESCSFNNSLQM